MLSRNVKITNHNLFDCNGSRSWEVGPKNWWEMGSEFDGMWKMDSLSWCEVGPRNRWEMGGWLPKQMGHGSLRPLPYPLINTAHLTDNEPSNLSHSCNSNIM